MRLTGSFQTIACHGMSARDVLGDDGVHLAGGCGQRRGHVSMVTPSRAEAARPLGSTFHERQSLHGGRVAPRC